jgi:GntP family gluconate:H+ symporter
MMIDPLWLMLIGMIVVVGGILMLRLHAFFALIAGAIIVGVLTSPEALRHYAADKNMSVQDTEMLTQRPVGQRVADEFGRTCVKIGILIAMASIIGKSLLESGAAERIVRSALRLFGKKRAPLAFLTSGFTLGIPVYFDTVFYLMIPLAKAMGLRFPKKYALYVLAVVAGGTMAHSLVPPTPGPLFVAGELSVSLGLMIIGGLVVGIITVSAGFVYAIWASKKWPIPIRDSADISRAELETLAKKDDSDLPGIGISLLPIILPIILIAGKTLYFTFFNTSIIMQLPWLHQALSTFFTEFGDPNIALSISAAIALGTFVWQKRSDKQQMISLLQHALSSGGLIILITSAGGAFGGMLQQTGIGHRIQDLANAYHIAILPLAFFVTALVRTAQGSATVAMITAIGILGGLSGQGQLDFHPLYLALVIGCGSKPIPWMNDSGFWVIGRMSGMTESETLKLSSALMTLMGVVGLFAVMILAYLFPLI